MGLRLIEAKFRALEARERRLEVEFAKRHADAEKPVKLGLPPPVPTSLYGSSAPSTGRRTARSPARAAAAPGAAGGGASRRGSVSPGPGGEQVSADGSSSTASSSAIASLPVRQIGLRSHGITGDKGPGEREEDSPLVLRERIRTAFSKARDTIDRDLQQRLQTLRPFTADAPVSVDVPIGDWVFDTPRDTEEDADGDDGTGALSIAVDPAPSAADVRGLASTQARPAAAPAQRSPFSLAPNAAGGSSRSLREELMEIQRITEASRRRRRDALQKEAISSKLAAEATKQASAMRRNSEAALGLVLGAKDGWDAAGGAAEVGPGPDAMGRPPMHADEAADSPVTEYPADSILTETHFRVQSRSTLESQPSAGTLSQGQPSMQPLSVPAAALPSVAATGDAAASAGAAEDDVQVVRGVGGALPPPVDVTAKEFYLLKVKVSRQHVDLRGYLFDVYVSDISDARKPAVVFKNVSVDRESHIIFHPPNGTVLNPVDDFPFVEDPLDLCGHTLRIEVYGVHPVTSRVVDSTVTFQPSRGPPAAPSAVRAQSAQSERPPARSALHPSPESRDRRHHSPHNRSSPPPAAQLAPSPRAATAAAALSGAAASAGTGTASAPPAPQQGAAKTLAELRAEMREALRAQQEQLAQRGPAAVAAVAAAMNATAPAAAALRGRSGMYQRPEAPVSTPEAHARRPVVAGDETGALSPQPPRVRVSFAEHVHEHE